MSGIELRQVTKVYRPGGVALEAIDLTIEAGERVVVLGPSGSGKTTLLRLIAGLESPDGGMVRIGGRNMEGVPPHGRDVAMVFQNPALYPHLNVLENMAFGLRARGVARAERRRRVAQVAELLGLDRLLQRQPAALSGGERQRVAIGRAVVRRPRVLLLDEPFASLDLPLRATLRNEVVDLHRRFGLTLIHVTHDQGEALSMGQRVAVLNRGRLMQFGPPREIYDQPAHRLVAAFVGSPAMNILPCEILREESALRIRLVASGREEVWRIPTEVFAVTSLPLHQPRRVDLGIRPESIALRKEPDGLDFPPGWQPTTAVVRRLEFQGEAVLVTLAVGEQPVCARIARFPDVPEGQRVVALLDLGRACLFDPDTGQRWEPGPSPFS